MTKEQMQSELLSFLQAFWGNMTDLMGFGDRDCAEDAMRNSPIWTSLDGMFDYGVQGIIVNELMPGGMLEGFYAKTATFLQSFDTAPMRLYLATQNISLPILALRTTQMAIARMVLDGGERHVDYASEEHGWGNGNYGYLTLSEVALLANMEERSVRNAANPKLADPLVTCQIGRRSLVEPEEARRWLAKRKGFIPTQEMGDQPKAKRFSAEITPQLFEVIQKEANKAGIPPQVFLQKLFAGEIQLTSGKLEVRRKV